MKYLILFILCLIPLQGFAQEARKTPDLPDSVKQAAEMRIKVIVEIDGGTKTFLLLVPRDGVSFEKLKAALAQAKIAVANDATRKSAKDHGGWQIFKSLFNSNFVLVPCD